MLKRIGTFNSKPFAFLMIGVLLFCSSCTTVYRIQPSVSVSMDPQNVSPIDYQDYILGVERGSHLDEKLIKALKLSKIFKNVQFSDELKQDSDFQLLKKESNTNLFDLVLTVALLPVILLP